MLINFTKEKNEKEFLLKKYKNRQYWFNELFIRCVVIQQHIFYQFFSYRLLYKSFKKSQKSYRI